MGARGIKGDALIWVQISASPLMPFNVAIGPDPARKHSRDYLIGSAAFDPLASAAYAEEVPRPSVLGQGVQDRLERIVRQCP